MKIQSCKIVLCCALLGLTACATWRKLNGTEQGAVVGTGTGAVIGTMVSPGVGGAVVGGILGGAGGGLVGHEIDRE